MRVLVTVKVWEGRAVGLEVGASLGPQSLLFLVSHLCHYGSHKLSTALLQKPSESHANKPL